MFDANSFQCFFPVPQMLGGGETLRICQSTFVQCKHSQIEINLAELPGEMCQDASHLEPELKVRPAQTTEEKNGRGGASTKTLKERSHLFVDCDAL